MGILVFDVGTSSMRGALLNDKAEILCQFHRKYHPTFYSSVKVTQDPEIWRKALYDIARDVGDWCKDQNEEVEMISLTAQRTSIIPVDHKGDPLCDAVMWQDKRNIEVCTRLSAMNGQIIRKSGTMVNPVFSGSKMAWLKETQPEIYKKADRIFVVADYLLYHMTGQRKLDRTYASRSHLMNLRTGRWDSVLLDIFGIEKNKLCDLIDPGELHGYTNEKFAASTRLKTGIPVYSAGGDQQCSALGMGIYEEGDMEVTSGTGAFIIGITEKVPIVLLGNPIINYSAVKRKYIVEASILTCSAAFDWFCNNFYKEVKGDVYQKIDQEIAQSPPGANGCMLLPFFQGRATPQWNPKATASFTNVTLSTTRGDMARALLEGIAYEIRNNLDIVERINRKIIIDHHRRSPDIIEGALLNYIEVYASSTSEMVTELIQYMLQKPRIPKIVAEGLLGGIFMDTKGFQFKSGVRTFDAAAFLRSLGADTIEVKKMFTDSLDDYLLISDTIRNAEVHENLAIAVCPSGVNNTVIVARAADELLGISGIDVCFVLCNINDSIIISGRSTGEVNVQVILEELGGGGHMNMAGAKLECTIDEAVNLLKEAINKHLEIKE